MNVQCGVYTADTTKREICMIMHINIKFVYSLIAIAGLLVLPFIVPAPNVSAVSCSGNGCNGKDPIYTGCNQNAYLAKRFVIPENSSGLALWQTFADVYYSRSCGTNWVRVTQNPFGGTAFKSIYTSSYTVNEYDRGYGSSYSMQVYAPGSTRVNIFIKLYDTANTARATAIGYLQ